MWNLKPSTRLSPYGHLDIRYFALVFIPEQRDTLKALAIVVGAAPSD
jgi:hypothetical protein